MKINWKSYKTDFDKMPANIARRGEAFERGLQTGQAAKRFHIGQGGVWSSANKNGSHTKSYEMLGYHANTAYFLRGVLSSGVEIVDHRQTGVMNRFDSLPV